MEKVYLSFMSALLIFFLPSGISYSQNSLRLSGASFKTDTVQIQIPKLSLTTHNPNSRSLKSLSKSISLLNIPAREKSNINVLKFSSLVAVTVGMSIGLHQLQKNAWWNGQRGDFHIQNDWGYAMSMDKIAHFMEGGLIAKTMKGAFLWSGMNETSAMWFGALFSIAYMTDIEIEDGFATDWGYSPGDELANISGDIFSIAQDLWKPLQTEQIKWSYVPTNDPLHKGDFPDDYSGQVFWLSFDINKYFGEKFKKNWPEFLNVAIGYGVKDYDHYEPGGRQQLAYLGLDIDLRKVIPGNSSFMKFIKDFLNIKISFSN